MKKKMVSKMIAAAIVGTMMTAQMSAAMVYAAENEAAEEFIAVSEENTEIFDDRQETLLEAELEDETEEAFISEAEEENADVAFLSEEGQETFAEAPVEVAAEFTIDENTTDVNAVLKAAAESDGKVALIKAGNYDGFSVNGITLYVEGEVNVTGAVNLNNATLAGVTGRDTDVVNVMVSGGQEKAATFSGSKVTLENVGYNVTGATFNYLLDWNCTDLIVNKSKLTANGNTGEGGASGLFARGQVLTGTDSIFEFNDNGTSVGRQGKGIWADDDANPNVRFEITGGSFSMDGNGLNGFNGLQGPYFGTPSAWGTFVFNYVDVSACNNGKYQGSGKGDGFSYGRVTMVGGTLTVNGNTNNGFDGGRGNNSALNATGTVIDASNNGKYGLHVSQLNANTSASSLENCVVTANNNGNTGVYFSKVTNVLSSRVTANENGYEGIHFSGATTLDENSALTTNGNKNTGLYIGGAATVGATTLVSNQNGACGVQYNNNLTMDGASSLTANGNTKSGLYAYGQTYTADIASGAKLTLLENRDIGLYTRNKSFVARDGVDVSIMRNHTATNGGGVRVEGYYYSSSYGETIKPAALTLPSDAKLYNNHADNAGDDIYLVNAQSSITFGPTGADWALDGTPEHCTDAIDGWYYDGYKLNEETGEADSSRWNAHPADAETKYIEGYVVNDTTTASGTLALKAAHADNYTMITAEVADAKYKEITPIDYYQRTVGELQRRDVHKIYIPVFERKEISYEQTLVTRIFNEANKQLEDSVTKKNGHTAVKINLEDAKNGLDFVIADSSRPAGKKSSPDSYNRPIDFTYHVEYRDGKIIITFPDTLVNASVGADVYYSADAAKNAPNAPKHTVITNGESFEVAVDASKLATTSTTTRKGGKGDKGDKGDSTTATPAIWLYFHLDSLNYNVKGEDGEYEYVFKEWRYNEALTEEEGTGEYKVVEGGYADPSEFVRTENKVDEKTAEYTGNLTLTCNNGENYPLGEKFFLAPGDYTFTVSGEGLDPVTDTVTISAGPNNSKFDLAYHVADVTNKTERKDLDDVIGETRYEDNILEDWHYGNETDPEGEYAVKLN